MTDRFVPTPIVPGASSVGHINDNFQRVSTEIDNTLSRVDSENNAMEVSLDMNGQRIINLPEPQSPLEPMRMIDAEAIMDAVERAETAADAAAMSEYNANVHSGLAQLGANIATAKAQEALDSANQAEDIKQEVQDMLDNFVPPEGSGGGTIEWVLDEHITEGPARVVIMPDAVEIGADYTINGSEVTVNGPLYFGFGVQLDSPMPADKHYIYASQGNDLMYSGLVGPEGQLILYTVQDDSVNNDGNAVLEIYTLEDGNFENLELLHRREYDYPKAVLSSRLLILVDSVNNTVGYSYGGVSMAGYTLPASYNVTGMSPYAAAMVMTVPTVFYLGSDDSLFSDAEIMLGFERYKGIGYALPEGAEKGTDLIIVGNGVFNDATLTDGEIHKLVEETPPELMRVYPAVVDTSLSDRINRLEDAVGDWPDSEPTNLGNIGVLSAQASYNDEPNYIKGYPASGAIPYYRILDASYTPDVLYLWNYSEDVLVFTHTPGYNVVTPDLENVELKPYQRITLYRVDGYWEALQGNVTDTIESLRYELNEAWMRIPTNRNTVKDLRYEYYTDRFSPHEVETVYDELFADKTYIVNFPSEELQNYSFTTALHLKRTSLSATYTLQVVDPYSNVISYTNLGDIPVGAASSAETEVVYITIFRNATGDFFCNVTVARSS